MSTRIFRSGAETELVELISQTSYSTYRADGSDDLLYLIELRTGVHKNTISDEAKSIIRW